jgi:hypothetical protein
MDMRQYDPAIARWVVQDPVIHHNFSPYSAFDNNPVYWADPSGADAETNLDSFGRNKTDRFGYFIPAYMRGEMGGLSTIVKDLGNGKYEVIDGDANDGDRGIYVDDGNGGKGKKIGESITSHSFFDPNEEVVSGAIIDTNSKDGQNFIDKLIEENPTLLYYMVNALRGGIYDFKKNGINERDKNQTELQYLYRGSVAQNGNIGSARDFGNIGAGLVAARKGFSWTQARVAFDMLETAQESKIVPLGGKPIPLIKPALEGINTVKAQMVGFAIGIQRFRR